MVVLALADAESYVAGAYLAFVAGAVWLWCSGRTKVVERALGENRARALALLTRPTRGTVRLHGAAPETEAERLAWRRRMALSSAPGTWSRA